MEPLKPLKIMGARKGSYQRNECVGNLDAVSGQPDKEVQVSDKKNFSGKGKSCRGPTAPGLDLSHL